MISFFKALFSESNEVSAMRVMAVTALGMGGAVAAYGMYRAFDLTGLSVLCGVFVGAAFGGKAWQKKNETKE